MSIIVHLFRLRHQFMLVSITAIETAEEDHARSYDASTAAWCNGLARPANKSMLERDSGTMEHSDIYFFLLFFILLLCLLLVNKADHNSHRCA